MVSNTHASKTPDSSSQASGKVAYETPCRYCQAPIYVAICADGKWRSFEKRTVPAAAAGVWAWRKRQGMQETDKVPGQTLHFCAQHDGLGTALRDLIGGTR